MRVVNGRKMMPSKGRRKVLNAASTRTGLAIQTMSSARRGKRPPSSANRQPILSTSYRVFPSCLTSLEHKPTHNSGSSPRDAYPLGDFHPWRLAVNCWCVESPRAEAPIRSSFPLSQAEGEYDQGQANHHCEDTDERR